MEDEQRLILILLLVETTLGFKTCRAACQGLQRYHSQAFWLFVGLLRGLLVTKSWSFAGLMRDVFRKAGELETWALRHVGFLGTWDLSPGSILAPYLCLGISNPIDV